jgi:hypothetical protein
MIKPADDLAVFLVRCTDAVFDVHTPLQLAGT